MSNQQFSPTAPYQAPYQIPDNDLTPNQHCYPNQPIQFIQPAPPPYDYNQSSYQYPPQTCSLPPPLPASNLAGESDYGLVLGVIRRRPLSRIEKYIRIVMLIIILLFMLLGLYILITVNFFYKGHSGALGSKNSL